jgi:glycosyltransferase involved in cell wall biosynthesis
MKIVLLTEYFSRNMGYICTVLPKYLAKAGAEMHVVSLNRPPYWRMQGNKEIFQGFLDQEAPLTPGLVEELDGYTLHVLDDRTQLGYIRMLGLKKKLMELRPDIVQTRAAIGWIPLDAARFQRKLGYKLFTGNHNAWSTAYESLEGGPVLWAKNLFTRFLPGRMASWRTEKCYAVTVDCAEIAWRFYGVERRKVVTMHLGVDTDYFYLATDDAALEERRKLRRSLGISEKEVVCIYTGKMTEAKNALILAEAVCRLRELGREYSAIFIGNGAQREAIEDMPYCRVLDFMHFSKLGAYYRAADIGVWPTNESTSMLDAAACGLPLVVSDGIIYRDHVDGNGRVFRMNDLNSLITTLWELEPEWLRKDLGVAGAAKMAEHFSWESVARRRMADYQYALSAGAVADGQLRADSHAVRERNAV